MTSGPGKEMIHRSFEAKTPTYLSSFPVLSTLETEEQMRRFELLRLAFFVLKLRKIEQRLSNVLDERDPTEESKEQRNTLEYRCSLLRHVIFQQVLTLIRLNAREQAMQIIDTCHKQ